MALKGKLQGERKQEQTERVYLLKTKGNFIPVFPNHKLGDTLS